MPGRHPAEEFDCDVHGDNHTTYSGEGGGRCVALLLEVVVAQPVRPPRVQLQSLLATPGCGHSSDLRAQIVTCAALLNQLPFKCVPDDAVEVVSPFPVENFPDHELAGLHCLLDPLADANAQVLS